MAKSSTSNDANIAGDSLEILSIKDAAQRLRVSRWTIYELIRKRQLQSFKIGSRRLVQASAIRQFVKSRLEEKSTLHDLERKKLDIEFVMNDRLS